MHELHLMLQKARPQFDMVYEQLLILYESELLSKSENTARTDFRTNGSDFVSTRVQSEDNTC